jgi:hypothetical protein
MNMNIRKANFVVGCDCDPSLIARDASFHKVIHGLRLIVTNFQLEMLLLSHRTLGIKSGTHGELV